MTKRLLIALCVSLFLTTGCNIIYKQNIQQGNALEQEDLDQLELGMSKNQVSFVLGTPAIRDPFHHDRWDYISSFARRGGDPVRRLVTLEFENDALTSMDGVRPGQGEEVLTADGAQRVTPAVPLVGVDVTEAEDYQDLVILRDGAPTWTLQLKSFSDRQSANLGLARALEAGVPATIFGQVIDGVGFFVLRTGEFDTQAEAFARQRELEDRYDIRVFVVTPGT